MDSNEQSRLESNSDLASMNEIKTGDDNDKEAADDDGSDTIEFEIELVSSSLLSQKSSKSSSLVDLQDNNDIEDESARDIIQEMSVIEQPSNGAQVQEDWLIGSIDENANSKPAEEKENKPEEIASIGSNLIDSNPIKGISDIAQNIDETTYLEIESNQNLEVESEEATKQCGPNEFQSNLNLITDPIEDLNTTNPDQSSLEETQELDLTLQSSNNPITETAPAGPEVKSIVAEDLNENPQIELEIEESNNSGDNHSSGETIEVIDGGINMKQDSFYPPKQSVGSLSLKESHKLLNSDYVIIVECEADTTSEPECQNSKQQPAEEAIQEPVIIVEQLADTQTIDVAESRQVDELDSSRRDLSVESPTLSRLSLDQFLSKQKGPEEGERQEEDDLEWEFDHEPSFERRDVKVKHGQDPKREYELGDELGRGKFGTVVRCTHLESGRKLAAKFVLVRRKEDREDFEREVEIMSLLQHKRLLQLFDAFDDGFNETCLIMELVEGGELFERIIDDDFELTERKAAIFMRQICEGVNYMHSQSIVHLDLKPENILCISRAGNRIKLIDFGLARILQPNELIRVMFGTPDFAAPEVLSYDLVSLATDMWSVGVICYVLLSGLSPFMGCNDLETMANVTRATYDFDDDAFLPISDLAKDFISKLLIKDQTKRLKPDECLKHAWLARGGIQLEAAVRERRRSIAIESLVHDQAAQQEVENLLLTSSITVSLDKTNLKKYVVRRKWHKTVHAIMALGRMGAKLKSRLMIS